MDGDGTLNGQEGRRGGAYADHRARLGFYYVLTYLAVLVSLGRYLGHVEWVGSLTAVFAVVVWLTYPLVYVTAVFLPVLAAAWVLWHRRLDGVFRRAPWVRTGLPYALAAVLTSALQVFLYADEFLLDLYGWHINGYVVALVTAPGGMDAMGAGAATYRSFALIIAALAAVQAGLLAAVLAFGWLRRAMAAVLRRRVRLALVVLAGAMLVFQAVTYGVCKLEYYTPVLEASEAFPLYVPVTFSKLGRALGLQSREGGDVGLHGGAVDLRYPLAPLVRRPGAERYSVVWLVAESWRADMVDPEIMPRTHAFARKAIWSRRHYTGGNETRMGLFTLFYGLYGSYWFPVLQANRGPVIFDLLLADGYQFRMYTSQSFTYPEFDRTIFVRLPHESLQPVPSGYTWQRDRKNLAGIVDFLRNRDASRPLAMFMFFESAHADYRFPPDCAIRRPYLEELNYARMNLARDIGLIKNRYINACHHLDSQIGGVLEALRAEGLLDRTIVVVTADHGEEFMEAGRWGHAALTFSEMQTHVPMILWVPGRPAAEIDYLTSHLDVPATLLAALGVTNPPADYSLGLDMLGPTRREFNVITGWDVMACVDAGYKVIVPYGTGGFRRPRVTTAGDAEAGRSLPPACRDRLVQIMKEMRRFGQ